MSPARCQRSHGRFAFRSRLGGSDVNIPSPTRQSALISARTPKRFARARRDRLSKWVQNLNELVRVKTRPIQLPGAALRRRRPLFGCQVAREGDSRATPRCSLNGPSLQNPLDKAALTRRSPRHSRARKGPWQFRQVLECGVTAPLCCGWFATTPPAVHRIPKTRLAWFPRPRPASESHATNLAR